MNKVEYRGHYLSRISKRNSNLKWRVRFLGEDEPRRVRTKADAMALVDFYEDRKAQTEQAQSRKEVN
jgi:hypothetical protein